MTQLKTDCIKNPFGKNTEGSKNRSGKQNLRYILFRTTTCLEKMGIKTQHPLDWVTWRFHLAQLIPRTFWGRDEHKNTWALQHSRPIFLLCTSYKTCRESRQQSSSSTQTRSQPRNPHCSCLPYLRPSCFMSDHPQDQQPRGDAPELPVLSHLGWPSQKAAAAERACSGDAGHLQPRTIPS